MGPCFGARQGSTMRFLAIIAALAATAFTFAQQDVKGQSQLAGGTGQFGTTYSYKNGFNMAILGAHYTLDAFDAYTKILGDQDKKLVVLDLAIKNASKSDSF